MKLKFTKISATGNDFILVDDHFNRDSSIKHINENIIKKVCDRNNGIGADGLIVMGESNEYDFKMHYFNADGTEADMCGNGGRAVSYIASQLTSRDDFIFETKNGIYKSYINKDDPTFVKLQMSEIKSIRGISLDWPKKYLVFNAVTMLDVGVPHINFLVDSIDSLDIEMLGHLISRDKRFVNGINVNFCEVATDNSYYLRTYERGVGVTLSCGTGAVATAFLLKSVLKIEERVDLINDGGRLTILFDNEFKEVYLCGKVEKILTGFFDVT